jgi:endonuclease/exonuclease/phosphatase family metal-dependent hydrolase
MIAPTFTVAAFNAHWGVGRSGPHRARRFDVAEVIRGFDADVVVVPEAFRFEDGTSVLDPLEDDGWAVRTTHFGRIEAREWRPGEVRPAGAWELAICSRLAASDWCELLLPSVFRDHAGERQALACTVRVGDVDVDLFGFHASSKLWYAGPVTHIRGLARHLPHPKRPAVIAGDFNLWGPGVRWLLPGWERAVLGRTYPAHRPHSQIDHVLVRNGVEVVDAAVLDEVGSDHRPVRVTLRPV